MIVWPTVTWPSPAITIRPRWRTARMVVPRSSGTGVRLVIRLHQPAEVDVRVALCRREARVSEKLLDGAQVGPRAEEMRREGVTERVRAGLPGASGCEHVALHVTPDAPRRESPATRIAEHGSAGDRLPGLGAGGAIGGERAESGPADRHDAFLSTL